jgi:hypothetical protein
MRLRIALAALGIAVPGGAQASPQILALLSTGGPVPMECHGALCTAELSAFCLEERRATPEAGTVYRAAPQGTLVLTVTASDGSVREVSAHGYAAFTTLRDMTAVRVTIDRSALGDAARLAIRAGEEVALLPAPSSRHGRPHTTAEIALAVGPLRAAGARHVDRSAEAAVARDLTRALNALAQADEAAALMLAGAAAPVAKACATKVADDKARRASTIGVHGYWSGRGIVAEPSLRACLQAEHGNLMTRLNHAFWKRGSPPTAPPPPAPLRM